MWLALVVIGCSGTDGSTHSTPPVPTGDTGPQTSTITDLFQQQLVKEVDILWVIDTGWGTGLDALDPALDRIDQTLLLNDVDWRMGVLDSTEGGPEWGLIGAKWDTWPSPSNAFRFGPTGPGSRVRQTLYVALEAKKNEPQNDGFLRSSAELYTLVVTDGVDESSTEEVTDAQWNKWYTTLEPSASTRMGVVTVLDQESYWEGLAVNASVRSGAGLDKILDEMILEAIHLKTSFQLTRTPTRPPRKVEVIYRDHATVYHLNRDYEYDDATRTIAFRTIRPPDTSLIRVTYDVDPTATVPTSDTGSSTSTP